MVIQKNLSPMVDRLIGYSSAAFRERDYDAAFHWLAAANHAAQAILDASKLKEIEIAALDQLQWIDQYEPGYHHSTEQTNLRNGKSIYALLAQTAKTASMNAQRKQSCG